MNLPCARIASGISLPSFFSIAPKEMYFKNIKFSIWSSQLHSNWSFINVPLQRGCIRKSFHKFKSSRFKARVFTIEPSFPFTALVRARACGKRTNASLTTLRRVNIQRERFSSAFTSYFIKTCLKASGVEIGIAICFSTSFSSKWKTGESGTTAKELYVMML